MDEKYYYTALPRIPVAVKKKIEEKVAPLVQYRRRSIANSKILHAFREPNTLIEACSNGTWLEGHTISLDERIASRIVVRVKLEDGSEETLHVGLVCDRCSDVILSGSFVVWSLLLFVACVIVDIAHFVAA